MSEESVSLKEKLDEKLTKGEISQEEYDKLLEKFGSLDLLGSRVDNGSKQHSRHQSRRHSHSGRSTIEGGDYEEPISISGSLFASDSIKCPSMRISGAATIDGDLTVVETTKVSGKLDIAGQGKFGGSFSLSGKMSVKDQVFFTDIVKVSGKIDTYSDVTGGAPIKISGKVNANSLKSTSSVNLSGKLSLNQDLIADEFITSGGSSNIGGSIKATTVEIARKHREKANGGAYDPAEEAEDIESIPDLGRFVSQIVTKFIPMVITTSMSGSRGTPGTFKVGNNIEAKVVDISYTHVSGDVIGDIVKIGPGVEVDGTIRYRESFVCPDGMEYQTEKIE